MNMEYLAQQRFNSLHSYVVSQGDFEGFVFTPVKISRCGNWGWIFPDKRIHIKHVEFAKDSITLQPFNPEAIIKSRSRSSRLPKLAPNKPGLIKRMLSFLPWT